MYTYNIYIYFMVLINNTICVYHCLGLSQWPTLIYTRERDRPKTKAVELSRMVYGSQIYILFRFNFCRECIQIFPFKKSVTTGFVFVSKHFGAIVFY